MTTPILNTPLALARARPAGTQTEEGPATPAGPITGHGLHRVVSIIAAM